MTGKVDSIRPEFVEFIPERLEPGVLYVSIQYKSMAHLCCCGCGNKVVTPLSPTGWRVTFDGRSVTIHPSVGNWQKDCRSHYLIIQNQIRWARRWRDDEITAGLEHDREIKLDYDGESATSQSEASESDAIKKQPKRGWWSRRKRDQ